MWQTPLYLVTDTVAGKEPDKYLEDGDNSYVTPVLSHTATRSLSPTLEDQEHVKRSVLATLLRGQTPTPA